MSLLIATREGVFRSDGEIDDAERVLDVGNTPRIRVFDDRKVYAATNSGLFRSGDEGRTWTNLGVPREEVYSVVVGRGGERLFAGTHPAHLYVSTDEGETWDECEGFQALPSREEWHTPRHRNEAHVRSLGVHPDAPERIVAGVEVGGVHVSDDEGETWTERREGVHNDVHHVLVLGGEEYVASTGGGLYRTRDAGESWTRLDEDLDHRYFREAFAFDGTLYAAAARDPPPTWGGENGSDAALFESTDGGDSFYQVSYPRAPEEFVLAWTVWDDRVIAGTTEGSVLARENGSWTAFGRIPVGIRSLATV